MTLPIVSEDGVKPCDGCDAKLADLTRAVELGNGLTEDLRRTIVGLEKTIDLLTQHSQWHTDQVAQIVQQIGQFGSMMGSMGPAGMIKAMMGKGKDNG